jgi:hypothetical protein
MGWEAWIQGGEPPNPGDWRIQGQQNPDVVTEEILLMLFYGANV